MIELSLSTIAQQLNGQLIGQDCLVNDITTDSRAIQKDQIFLALKGENFDGHKFCQQAAQQGAKALIVSTKQDIDIAQVVVNDCHLALGQLAAYVKAQVAPKTVAITGSSGKTTVKEMVAAILSRLGRVLATAGNFNNNIGVPLTLLRLTHEDDFAVVELGANHIGEITYTTNLTKPDVALINNIAAAHLEGFGSIEGVARAKGEIFQGLSQRGSAIYNQAHCYSELWQENIVGNHIFNFSCAEVISDPKADYYSSSVILDDNGCANFKLHTPAGGTFVQLTVPGQHNVCNAVAAAAIAIEMGASLDDISLGLAEMDVVKGRLNLHQLGEQFKLIDDSYNANVASMKAAISLLSTYPGKSVLVLGDMGELGSEAQEYHREVGLFAQSLGIDILLSVGELSKFTCAGFGQQAMHFDTKPALAAYLVNFLEEQETASSYGSERFA